MPSSIHSASYRIRTYRCYFSIDREAGSLRAYPSARRSYPVQWEQVINASGYATKRSLGNDEDEVTFAKYLVYALVFDRLTFGGKSLQTRNQPGDCIGDPRVVLDVLSSVEVARKGLPTPCEKVLHVALH